MMAEVSTSFAAVQLRAAALAGPPDSKRAALMPTSRSRDRALRAATIAKT